MISAFMVGMIASSSSTESFDCESMGSGELVGYISIVIALSTIFVGVKRYRDKYHKGPLKFGKAFLTGLYICLIATLVYVTSWVAYTGTDKGSQWSNQYTECMIEQYDKDENLTDEERTKRKETLRSQMEMYENPVARVAFTSMEILPVGLIIALISAALLRRKE